MDRTRRILAAVLILIAAGAEIPRQLLFGALDATAASLAAIAPVPADADGQTPPAQSSQSPQDALPAGRNHQESRWRVPNPAGGASSCWLLEVPLEGAAAVSRRDRMVMPLCDNLVSGYCCTTNETQTSARADISSCRDGHGLGSAVVVACRLIPLRN